MHALETGRCNRDGQQRPSQASLARKRAMLCRINGPKMSRCSAAEIIDDQYIQAQRNVALQ
jgi:hypothetical protein